MLTAHLVGMTVSMRVMSAGDGYEYLLRTVAAGDGDRSLSTPLTRYYTEEGTPPGFWMGSGLSFLGGGELAEGGQVSEAQLQLLVGMGHDPITGEPLGEAYRQYASVQERVDRRVADLDPDLGPVSRAEQVAAIEAEEAERGTRRAVAGYDLTFSVPKSLSALWGVADAGTQSLIADAQHQAVAEVVAFLERDVATTRVGAAGPEGAVAHVDVAGVLATAFDHYDSRSSDPQLHTHVVVSNKVLTVQDQKWRTLAGRPVHASVVALSELYNATLADRITGTFGIEWEARERGRDRNPAWELAPVPEDLIEEFSSRTRQIEEEKTRLIDAYRERHGREPSVKTVLRLRAQATLATRPEKQVHSLADLTADWRHRAGTVLGEDATTWACALATTGETNALLRADDVPLDTVADLGRSVVAVVGEKRSTWRRWNLHAEASRQLMGVRFASTEDREAITGMVTDAAEQASLRLTPPELASSPLLFRRPDGSSRFRHPSAVLYSTEELLAAEDRLLDRARATTGSTVDLAVVEKITSRPDPEGRRLGADQAEALQRICVSGRVVDVLVGPAGAGKTTAMSALKRAWERQHGTGSVAGLAPSENAAQVLNEELGIATDNTARWWQMHLVQGRTFEKDQLVILDEASLAGTGSLDRITGLAERAGAKVLLVGDWSQLQAVDAGGSFGMLVQDRDDAPELTDVHRFTQRWEKTNSLNLRHGRTSAIDTLIGHGRVRGGEQDAMVDAAYAAWRRDVQNGRTSILVAEARETVTQLNERARADLILDGTIIPGREVALHDGTSASRGDRVITRDNNRRLRSKNGKAWVRNGDRWTVTAVGEDGSITVRPEGRRFGGAMVLPASYVTEHVELGYAITGHRAQGITVDTAHTVVTATSTRENFYVAMTRGRHGNFAYVATDTADDAHVAPHPSDNPDATSRTVLYGVLQHVGAELSAHETITVEQERWGSIGQLAAEYETIAQAGQHDRWATLLETSGLTEGQVDMVLGSDAYGALSADFRRAEANHHDLDTLLPRLVRARGFEDADDIASVLHYRVARATARPAGSGRTRQAPRLIAGLIPYASGVSDPEMHHALSERQELIERRAAAVLDRDLGGGEPWTAALGKPPTDARTAQRWRRFGQVVAAYRDRYQIPEDQPLGTVAGSDAQKIDAARADAALHRAKQAFLRGRLWRASQWSDPFREHVSEAAGKLSENFRSEAVVDTVTTAISSRWQQLHHLTTEQNPIFEPINRDVSILVTNAEMLFEPSPTGRTRSARELSDGQQSLLHIALTAATLDMEAGIVAGKHDDEFDITATALPTLTLLAIEEPENNLAPFFLSRVVEQLLDVTATGRAQALISSHSASVMSRIPPEQVRHFRLLESTKTAQVREVVLPNDATEAGKYLREAIRAHPELYFARFVVLGEGDSEEVVLPKLAAARGLHIDQSFVAIVPLGGRHTNHFWRLLSQLGIPYATLLDLDWGRAGGGEGRIRDACTRLLEIGISPFDGSEGIDGFNSTDDIDDLSQAQLVAWVKHLEKWDIYFAAPLDLDMLLLTTFTSAYTDHLDAGQRGPSKAGDPRDAVLGESDVRPDVEYWDDTKVDHLRWYRYLFLTHSKPSTHLRALSHVSREDLAAVKGPLARLLERIGKAVTPT